MTDLITTLNREVKLALLLILTVFTLSKSYAQCPSSSYLYLSNNGIASVKAYWYSSNVNQTYTLEYGLTGFDQGTGTIVTGLSEAYTSVSILNLLTSSTYDFYMYETCLDGGYTDTLSNSITSVSACAPANYIDVFNDEIASVIVYWASYHQGQTYTIEYGLSGFVQGTGITETGTSQNNNNISISGLQALSVYDFYMYETCAEGGNTDTIHTQVTTLDNCPTANYLGSSNNGIGSVVLHWSSFHEGQTYTVEYGLSGFSQGSGTHLTGTIEEYNNISISDLQASSIYDFHLHESCAAGGVTDTISTSYATMSACAASDNMDIYNNGVASVRLYWSSFHVGQIYTIEYGLPGFTLGTGTQHTGISQEDNSVHISGVTPSSNYDFYMYESCAEGGNTDTIYTNITTLSECEASSYLQVNNIGIGSVRISWGSYHPGQAFTIEYGLMGFTPGTGTQMTGVSQNDNDHTINGLQAASNYDFYLEEDCAAGGSTNPISNSISTLSDCEAPSYMSLDNDGIGSLVVYWNSYHLGQDYTIEYGISGFSQGSGTIVTGTSQEHNNVAINGLEIATNYDFYLYETCSAGGITNTISGSVTTIEACESANYLDLDNNGIGEVKLRWNSYHAGQNYTIEYGLSGFTPGTGTVETGVCSNENTVIISDLQGITLYDFYLSETCEAGGMTNPMMSNIMTVDECPQVNVVHFNEASDAVLINWSSFNVGQTYYIEYGLNGFAQGTGTNIEASVLSENLVYLDNLTSETYYDIYIYESCLAGGNTNTQTFSFLTLASFPAPINDICDSAEDIFIGANYLNTAGATNIGTPTDNCLLDIFPEIYPYTRGAWYKYSALENNNIMFSVCDQNGNIDPKLAIYSGSCTSLVCEGGAYDCKKVLPVIAGTDYYVFIYDQSNINTGNLQLNLTVYDDYLDCSATEDLTIIEENDIITVSWTSSNDYVLIWGEDDFDIMNNNQIIGLREREIETNLNTEIITGLDTTISYDLYLVEFCNDHSDIELSMYNVLFNSVITKFALENSINIYPNPTTGKVYIQAEKLEQVKVYNLSGRLIKTTDHKQIDLSQEAKGIYFVRVITSNGSQTKKLVLE